MGTTLGISWSYDIFSIWSRCIFDLKSFNCSFLDPNGFDPWISLVHSLILMGTTLWDFFGSFLDPDGFDPWISLVHSLILMGSISKNSRSRNEPVVKKAGKEQ